MRLCKPPGLGSPPGKSGSGGSAGGAAAGGGGGELLHYGQAPASDGSQVVTFPAMQFG